VTDAVQAAADEIGATSMRMISRGYHDAGLMAQARRFAAEAEKRIMCPQTARSSKQRAQIDRVIGLILHAAALARTMHRP